MEPRAALTEALKGWKKTRDPRFAAIADWATDRALEAQPPRPPLGRSGKKADVAAWVKVLDGGDALDLPRLLAAIGPGKSALATERILLLGKLDDPRVVTALLALLENPPFRASTAIGFFRGVAQVLSESKDPRVRDALLDLAARYPAIIESSVGPTIAALLRRTAESMDQVTPGPLSPALEETCAALEAHFEVEKAQARRVRATQKTEQTGDDALLSAIYAAPDDDAPRLVFADTLTERGDRRGEFISLQLARAQARATPAQRARERELLGDPQQRATWSLPLQQGGTCRLERGFPVELGLDPRSAKTVVDHPALATVKKLSGLEREPPLKHLTGLLFSKHARHVAAVDGFTRRQLEALDRPLPWREVGLRILPTHLELQRLTGVRRLSVANGMEPHTTLAPNALTGLGALEHLEYGSLNLPAPEAFAPLVSVTHLTLQGWSTGEQVAPLLRQLPRLTTLELRFTPAAEHLQGLKLERLTVRGSTPLGPLLDAVPTLREVTFTQVNFPQVSLETLGRRGDLSRLLRATFNDLTFIAPWTSAGALEFRPRTSNAHALPGAVEALAKLPEGCVQKLVLRPRNDDPADPAGAPPTPAEVAALQAAARVPVEVAWY